MPRSNAIDFRFSHPRPSFTKRYLSGWAVTAIILTLDLVWLSLSHRYVKWVSVEVEAKELGVILFSIAALGVVHRIPRYRPVTTRLRYDAVSKTIAWYLLLICFSTCIAILSYLCVTLDAPLVDGGLVRFDRTIGFDWLAMYQWVQAHRYCLAILSFAYESGRWQLLFIPCILGLFGRSEDISEFLSLFMVSSVLLLVVSAPFPAASAFVHFHVTAPNTVSTVSDFAILRDGSMRVFDLTGMQGLVSMPSFHTTLAVIFTYSLRRLPRFFWCAAVLNTVMLVSTPTQGGHYLADVFAGLLLSAITIVCVQARGRFATGVSGSSNRCVRSQPRFDFNRPSSR
ncbi:phosphatase PAP2 family protein [Paraburkholderia sp. BCC1886]|uniref:phosphatase PAP2 family protein n=1 Tax=Paraburkholderia sp. BCC1886 TaxID=2562670 RepID=UPI0011829A38|nr:phosphatase PAP2 family protein [Paraburkholderia sp. BCC1886]